MAIVSTLLFPEVGTQHTHRAIALADPLDADIKINALSELNAQHDLAAVVALTYELLPVPRQIMGFSYVEAAAAMRDLGLCLGSIKKLGVEPVQAVPELEYVLFELANLTNLPPRDTLLHYTLWNPEGLRLRTYTNTTHEVALIKSVQIAYPALNTAIDLLVDLHMISFQSAEFGLKLQEVGKYLDIVINGLVHAYKEVDPHFFATSLRMFYDPIDINKEQYLGPGAVELPLFILDKLLWANEVKDTTYRQFQEAYLPYILPKHRRIFYAFDQESSLLGKVAAAVQSGSIFSEHVGSSLTALKKMGLLLKGFRQPHRKLANKAYKSENHTSSREVGSGGYSVGILDHIFNLMQHQYKQFDKAYELYMARFSWSS